jgi:hypothetical protein
MFPRPSQRASHAELTAASSPSGKLRRVKRRSILSAGLAVLGTAITAEHSALASVSVLMTLDELVTMSDECVIATALDHQSRWENLPSGKRIVTYTHLSIDETLAGKAKSEIWVRTLGGVVDDIGQNVSGEARIALNQRAVFFLADVDNGDGTGATIVTGMAQGHFPLDESGTEPKLKASPDRGELLPRRGPSLSAAEVLVGQPLTQARSRIDEAAGRAGKRRTK